MVNRVATLATVGVAAAGVTVGVWPSVADVVPPCPFQAATGLDCPGCGMTRAIVALTRGDLGAAIGHNAIAVSVALPLLLMVWVAWMRDRPAPAILRGPAFVPAIVGVLGTFTLGRNIPVAPLSALAA